MKSTTAARATGDPVCPVTTGGASLPGEDLFRGPVEHRGWYRTHVVALVSRSDINNQMIAAAAGVSGRTISDWFLDETGMSPQAYRNLHGLKKFSASRVAPIQSSETFGFEELARTGPGSGRFAGRVSESPGRGVDLVLDLRDEQARRRMSIHRVLAQEPTGVHKHWRRTLPIIEPLTGLLGGGSPVSPACGWDLEGYGLGSHKDWGTSVLTLTRTETGTGSTPQWCCVILTDARAHGKFALSWVDEVLPDVATAFRTGTHTRDEAPAQTRVRLDTRDRQEDAAVRASRSLATLAEVLRDTDARAAWERADLADGAPLEGLLAWAGAGVTDPDHVSVFASQGWGPEEARALRDYLGVDDFEAVSRLVVREGGRVDLNSVFWLLNQG
jgi:AraC-like DNA-binding protein